MQPLSGADAQFLYAETRTQHYHTIKALVIDPADSRQPLDFETFKKQFAGFSGVVPVFHWQLVLAPLNLAHPFWSWREELDLDYHIRRAAVLSPGGEREFCEVISEIASTGLERDRPLFQTWWVEGLAGGRLAYVVKLHHALADGLSSAQLLLDATQEGPDDDLRPPALRVEGPEPLSTRARQLVESLRFDVQLALGTPRFVARLLRFVAIGSWRALARKGRPASPYSAPITRFNQVLTPHRWFANVDLPMAELKRVRRVFGCTLNDVYVAVCAGAIRRYLELRGELPELSLTAALPVSIRTPEQQRTYGNRLSSWFVSIATDLADPVERLQAIQRNTRAARESWEVKDRHLQHDAMEYGYLYRGWMRLATALGRRFSGRPTFNVVISNVRGTPVPLYTAGTRIESMYPMSGLVPGQGLNLTVISYMGRMDFGFAVDPDLVPDAWELAEGIPRAFADLQAAAQVERGTAGE